MPPTENRPAVTIAGALADAARALAAAGVDESRLDSHLLLAWTLSARREDLAREPERVLTDREILIFEKAVALRAERRPLAYITGERVFYGRSFKVNRAVLVPRPETELLIDRALARLAGVSSPVVADIGTGSGCIAVTVAAERPDARVFATDISPFALRIARKNAVRYGVESQVALLAGDLCDPLPPEPFDAVLSNPPYVATADLAGLEPEVRDYEPALALIGDAGASGASGTDLYPRLFACVAARLRPGGWLIVEIGYGQAESVVGFARDGGLVDIGIFPDYAGVARVAEARRPG